MSTTSTRELHIEADPNLPTVRMTREFDAPPELVYRAWTEQDLIVKWLGPDGYEMRVDAWDGRTGGHYRYTHIDGNGETYEFYGSFHELRPYERLVQTFCWKGMPDSVSLDTLTLEDLGGGRTRAVTYSVFDSIEARDGMVAAGMADGVRQGYDKLDTVLAELR